jgi:hypothetical protein
MQSKITHKVLLLKERPDGGKWWLPLGGGAPVRDSRDGALNLYLDTLPSPSKDGSIRLYVCPYSEPELREREQRRAAYRARADGERGRNAIQQASARGTLDYNGLTVTPSPMAASASDTDGGVPF